MPHVALRSWMRLPRLPLSPSRPAVRVTRGQPWSSTGKLQRFVATQHSFDIPAIDRKWQKRWQDRAAAPAAQQLSGKSKAYVLAMFPYPSGALHMGHLRNYAVADVLARYWHMRGHDVLHPMGWDAFGLPAENAAIERGVHPAWWTKENTARMRMQLQAMNSGMDWTREFMTCDPEFYKHTQKLFLLLHRHGLAYQAESLVNYDPVDKTVLANEQVDANGRSWRSGAKVELVNLRQWFLKITAYREKLLHDLDFLGENGKWPERVLAMQRHWLGRSQGATIKFGIIDDTQLSESSTQVEVFTTRPDTLFGVQYLAVSAAHPLVTSRMHAFPELAAFVHAIPSMPADSKAGFQLPGVYGINPLSSLTSVSKSVHQPLPVFVAPYVLEGYGSGAVMGVPGHDSRDHAFWSQNRPDAEVKYTIVPIQHAAPESILKGDAVTTHGYTTEACMPFANLSSKDAMTAIVSALADHGLASAAETWRLRDWLVSRQRYWGTPIPIVHCSTCGPVPVPDSDLPVKLPDVDGTWFQSRKGNPLEAAHDWVNVPCPKCGSAAKRDTDTMDTFMDSSWYFFRFTDPRNKNELFDPAKADSDMPVDIYIGGIEHAILHLLYARFISKFLADIGSWPAGNKPQVRGEPFQKLLSQGMVHGKTYSDPSTGRFLKPEEIDFSDLHLPKIVQTGAAPNVSFEKMSKSKHNGVDPSAFIAHYGADVTRAHILFQAPVTEILEWDKDRIVGIQRWFQRVRRLVNQVESLATSQTQLDDFELNPETYNSAECTLHNAAHATVVSITSSLSETYMLNTCISDLMHFTNQIQEAVEQSSTEMGTRTALLQETTRTLVVLLAPFAPAFASECWEQLCKGSAKSHVSPKAWPDVYDQPFPTTATFGHLEVQTQTCVIMENGRKRLEISIPAVPKDTAGEELHSLVLEHLRRSPEGKAWFEQKGDDWDRVVVVKGGKTVNFVRKPSK